MNRRILLDNPISPTSATTRPIELYVFIDPLCNDCWLLQPILRKLQIQYERYFTLRIALRTSMPTMNMKCLEANEDPKACSKLHPSFPSIAVKAAEFQGKRAGFRFLSKMLEYSFLKSRNVSSFSVLVEIAEKVNLDVDEFIRDFSSKNVLRALQVDLYLAREMEVETAPTFVYFNENIEDEGLKVSGLYTFAVYEQILGELLGESLSPDPPPTLDDLLHRFDTMTTEEIADIYQISEKSAERELKKRLLQQHVERLLVQDTTLWRRKPTTL
ncbi:dithiol-disulfide isomerase [Bacillus sp. OxB-1]|uniref:DsbA family protein n=1 Tax=Bacillus sp. (strain OxB-1) TaxID=98228 RepID=UPI000581E567|nr:DsbA family protein [Bacillus sp. OxB-1]BAQ10287.1 dithiol-disulfide isomerase [Bacillus sp. OxB-1]